VDARTRVGRNDAGRGRSVNPLRKPHDECAAGHAAALGQALLVDGLALGSDTGAFQRRLGEALADNELTPDELDELDELEELLGCLADRVATMRAAFLAMRRGESVREVRS